ncbi:MAG TPA: HAMP domain-containing sensor histidine kinase [Candidatus Limnocylindrales bacterium]|jgi:signal transduction histidine kinase
MPDDPGSAAGTGGAGTDAAENAAMAADARLLRTVRLRLVAWSGGVTLLVLLVVGMTLYLAVQRSLADTATDQLRDRAAQIRREFARPGRIGPALAFAFGDPSGTVSLLVAPDGRTVLNLPRGVPLREGLPLEDAVAAAQAGSPEDIRAASVGSRPVRVLSLPIQAQSGTFVVQVIQDRAEEQRTLDVTLRVLLVGGIVALLVALGLGVVYANRALVPIRTSLGVQRAALRRQREFAADASHELRTPLTVIRTSVEHLERHATEPVATVGNALDDIRAEVGHLASLVDDLLLLARSDSGAVSLLRVPVDLGDVAADAAASLAATAEARGVQLEVDPAPAMVTGDPARLRQLVVLLLDNAIRHGPDRGRVTVRVRLAGDGSVLDVEDEGPGISPQHLDRVFDRFWRPPGARSEGTGLGLAIAQWIAGQHGGTIAVANRPEGGARFTVRLPAAGEDRGAPDATGPSHRPESGQLVEDGGKR